MLTGEGGERNLFAHDEAFRLLVSVCFFSSCVWLKKYFPQFGFDWTLLALMGMYEIRD